MRYIPHRLGIADALKQILDNSIKSEFMGVVNDFVLPIASAVLLVVLIVQIIRCWRDYRDHGEIDYVKPLIVGVCLALCIGAKVYMWAIIGW